MYFGNEYLQEAIYEQTVLNEMHISKEDLKDPNALKKVLDRAEKECEARRNIGDWISFILGVAGTILAGVATGSIAVSLIVFFFPFCFGASLLVLNIIGDKDKFRDVSLNKLQSKVEKVIKSTEKLKDCKEKTELLKTYNKLLKEVKDKKEFIEKEKKEQEARYKEQREREMHPENWFNKPYTLWEQLYVLANVIIDHKFTTQQFISYLDKHKEEFILLDVAGNFFGCEEDDTDEEGWVKYKRMFGTEHVYEIHGNDDYSLIYHPTKKKIIELYTDKPYINVVTDIQKYAKENI